MGDEANAITQDLKSKSGLYFELSTATPVFSYGYGAHQMPDFCVRLMKRKKKSHQALNVLRRMFLSTEATAHAITRLLRIGLGSPENDAEVVSLWTFDMFEVRLKEMRYEYERWQADNEAYQLPEFDPWSDPT